MELGTYPSCLVPYHLVSAILSQQALRIEARWWGAEICSVYDFFFAR